MSLWTPLARQFHNFKCNDETKAKITPSGFDVLKTYTKWLMSKFTYQNSIGYHLGFGDSTPKKSNNE
jgi:hypothetical protein